MSGKNFFLYSLLLSFIINFFLYFIFENKSAIGQGAYCQPLPYLTFSGPWPGQGYLVMTSSTPNVLVRYAGTGAGIVSGSGSPGQIAFWSGSSILSGDNNLFWDNLNKRLGIGTTTPQTSLHVIGDITANSFLGTINAANVSSGQFGANTGGGNYYFMGNVGIGTTTPTAKLYIRTTDTTTVPFQVEALVQPLAGWSYRRPITINNTANSNNLTDYQVLVTLNTQSLISAGKMRSDCGDIRFTDSNGSTLLNYWIESGCNTASTKIWIKVPSIPANSTKTIYVYYGNPSATSLSNGDATFLFFDDFLGTSLDATKWTTTGYGGYGEIYYSVSGSILTEWSNNTWRILRMNRNFAPSDTIAVEVKFLKTADSSWHTHYLVQYDNVDNNRLGLLDDVYAGANMGVQLRVSGGPWIYPKDFGPISSNVWYISRIIKKSSTTLYIDVLTSDRSFINSYETTQSAWSSVTWTWVNWQYENVQVKYDWIFVRKYTSPEPTTSVGAEESTLRQQTVFYLQPQTGNVGIGTTAPAEKLDVRGNVRFSGALMPAGNAGTSGQVLVSQGAGMAPQWQNPFNLTGFWKLLYVDAWNSSSNSNLGWSCPTCDGPPPYLTTCGTVVMLGGYGMFGTGDYFEKTFTGLPPHTEVMVEVFWWSIDSWDQDSGGVDLIALSIDGTQVSRATPYGPQASSASVRSSNASVCGNANWVDIGPQLLVGWAAHTAPNVTVRITNLANQASTDESIGIVMVRVWVK